jgi:hypothetical protein
LQFGRQATRLRRRINHIDDLRIPREMTTRELRQLLEDVEDTREIVLAERAAVTEARAVAELQTVWSAARAEANLAYDAWRATGGDRAYATYRAAEDRADAAEDALAAACVTSRPRAALGEPLLSSNGPEEGPIG